MTPELEPIPQEPQGCPRIDRQALIEAAISIRRGGVNVIPVDAQKKPIGKWKERQTKLITEIEIRQWKNLSSLAAFAVICGEISGGLIIFDFDVTGFYEKWCALIGDIAKELPLQQTGSGYGRQVAFRSEIALDPDLKSEKLAYAPADNDEGREIAIETRVNGGYGVLAPSFCYLASKHGKRHITPYTVLHGDFSSPPTLTSEEAKRLLDAAHSLCQAPLSLKEMKAAPIPPRTSNNGDGRIIDTFNQKFTPETILTRNGYKQIGPRYLPSNSTSGMPGVVIFDNGRIFSHNSSCPLNDGKHSHDVFSAYTILEHGGNMGAAVKAAAQELGIKPTKKKTSTAISGGHSFSDLGNARRLVAQHGKDLHYCHLSKKWWTWTGKVWAVDTTGEIIRRAKLTVASLYREAAAAGEKEREAIAKFALRSEHNQRIKGMIRLAESEPGIPITPGQMDVNPWLLNCLNGTVDLKSGKLLPHDRADLITRLAPIEFDPRATCPRWEKFLNHIQKTNHDVISFIQRILGYALTGDCREQCLFLLWGSGANGKSTLLAIISAILGNYAMQTPTETLLAKQRGEIPNDIARLNGPRFVTALEVSQGRRLAEPLVKQLTGQDTIAARFLFGEYFDFKPQFKLFLGTNHKPVIKDTTHAMWRRIRLIPFPVQIPEFEQDKALPDALFAEAPGILAWMVRGCLSWRHGGLGVPGEVTAATGEYRQEMDVLGDFINECCIIAPGASATAKELYQAYGGWAENSGEKRPLSQRAFGMSLTERGFERRAGTGNISMWWGIGLKDS